MRGRFGNIMFGVLMVLGVVVIGGMAQTSLAPGVALFKPVQVSDNSMAPTLTRGMLVIAYRITGNLKRWDLVVYSPRAREVQPGRIIGLPGEVVEIKGNQVMVNGLIASEPYVQEPIAYEYGPATVDAGSYFILGDNRNEAGEDSHTSGPIPRGRILARLMPLRL